MLQKPKLILSNEIQNLLPRVTDSPLKELHSPYQWHVKKDDKKEDYNKNLLELQENDILSVRLPEYKFNNSARTGWHLTTATRSGETLFVLFFLLVHTHPLPTYKFTTQYPKLLKNIIDTLLELINFIKCLPNFQTA